MLSEMEIVGRQGGESVTGEGPGVSGLLFLDLGSGYMGAKTN